MALETRPMGWALREAKFTAPQATALTRYEADLERAVTARKAQEVAEATEAVRRAQAALTLRQRAIVDEVVGRGRTLAWLVTETELDHDNLSTLLVAASAALAGHYERSGG